MNEVPCTGSLAGIRATLDSRVPNVARIYDVLLGGKDNYAADRQAARRLLAAIPDAARAALDNRAFLARAVRFLAAEAGIGQFLDIGTGIPSRGHVHEIARAANPDARVAYIDNDPVVVAYANALVVETPGVAAVNADLRFPSDLMTNRAVRAMIDFDMPVAVLLVAVLHFVADSESPWTAVRCIIDHLAPGSYLVVSHVCAGCLVSFAPALRRSSMPDYRPSLPCADQPAGACPDGEPPDLGPLRADAGREELANAVPAVADSFGRPPGGGDPLARDVACSLTEAGFTLHHCAHSHPLRRLGGVCLLPVGWTCDPGGTGGVVVSWTTHHLLSRDWYRWDEYNSVREVMNGALAQVLDALRYQVQPFGPGGAWIVTGHRGPWRGNRQ